MATIDSLTGTNNRQYFLELSEKANSLTQKHSWTASLIMMDLDLFKRINDTHGHAVGDMALKHFTAICQSSLRSEEILGRLGGEKFAIFLPNSSENIAMEIAERLRKLLETSTPVASEGIPPMTVSLGIATSAEGIDLDTLLSQADKALYMAKENGRNQSRIYT